MYSVRVCSYIKVKLCLGVFQVLIDKWVIGECPIGNFTYYSEMNRQFW